MEWPGAWGGPFMKLQGRVLSVNDGRDGFIIDFTGELPVYKPWSK